MKDGVLYFVTACIRYLTNAYTLQSTHFIYYFNTLIYTFKYTLYLNTFCVSVRGFVCVYLVYSFPEIGVVVGISISWEFFSPILSDQFLYPKTIRKTCHKLKLENNITLENKHLNNKLFLCI